LIINALFILLLYAAHPIGLILQVMMIGLDMLGLVSLGGKGKPGKRVSLCLKKVHQFLLVSALPTIVLFGAQYKVPV